MHLARHIDNLIRGTKALSGYGLSSWREGVFCWQYTYQQRCTQPFDTEYVSQDIPNPVEHTCGWLREPEADVIVCRLLWDFPKMFEVTRQDKTHKRLRSLIRIIYSCLKIACKFIIGLKAVEL